MNREDNKIYLFFREFFWALLGSLIIFACLEVVWPGIVLAYINLNFILLVWLLAGIVIISFKQEKR